MFFSKNNFNRHRQPISLYQFNLQERFAGLASSWSKSPRFPVSQLARSVSPVIALRELAIQPVPELTVTSFQDSDVKRSCHQNIKCEGESHDQHARVEESEENLKNVLISFLFLS